MSGGEQDPVVTQMLSTGGLSGLLFVWYTERQLWASALPTDDEELASRR